jgi:hypothetical protein
MTTPRPQPKRSFTGEHALLPASREAAHYKQVLERRAVPNYTLISWTLGRGSVVSDVSCVTFVVFEPFC